MILAAGLGKRMMPLTKDMPKPLLPLGNHRIIEHTLYRLSKVGINEVVINVSRYPKKVMELLGNGKRYGLAIAYSYETDKPLGTAGGINQALHLLGDDPFVLVSGDIWTDFPFESLLDKKIEKGHLVLVNNPDFHPQGDFSLTTNNLLSTAGKKYTYANIAVIHPDLLLDIKPGFVELGPVLTSAVKRGELTGEVYQGDWCNIGTPQQLAVLNSRLLQLQKKL